MLGAHPVAEVRTKHRLTPVCSEPGRVPAAMAPMVVQGLDGLGCERQPCHLADVGIVGPSLVCPARGPSLVTAFNSGGPNAASVDLGGPHHRPTPTEVAQPLGTTR